MQKRRNMKSTHLFGKFTHPSPKLIEILHFHFQFQQEKRTKIMFIEFYPLLLLTKSFTIYVCLLCNIFGRKIRLCKFFDKFQVGSSDDPQKELE